MLKAVVVKDGPPCPNKTMHSVLTWFTQSVSLAEATGLPADAGTMAAQVEPVVVFAEVVCHQLIKG